jgi:hypothetical protein
LKYSEYHTVSTEPEVSMDKNVSPTYKALLVLTIVFTLAAIATLVPNANASWENVLGYKSLCTFTPIATAICALLAGITCTIRARFFGPNAGQRRSWAGPIVVAIVLVAVIGFAIPPYAAAKADVGTAATADA